MADRTLTINHADGGSETYTIKRDKFAGVRSMSVDGDTVTVDHTAVPKEQSKETTFGGSKSITVKREIEPLLSKVVGGASAAYSLRDLNDKAGNNKVVRVRRASDNHEKDFRAKEVKDIATWVNTQAVLPLDIQELEADGRTGSLVEAAAAYSLRNLSTSYTGNVVDVRRSSDGAEDSFTAAEVADGTLTTWVGAGNDGFVTQWYDQSGNANHATQGANASQPKIVDGGSLVSGGLDFDGSDDELVVSGNPVITANNAGTYSAFSVQKVSTNNNGYLYGNASTENGSSLYAGDSTQSSSPSFALSNQNSATFQTDIIARDSNESLLSAVYNNGDAGLLVNGGGTMTDAGTYDFTSGTNNFIIGNRNGGTSSGTFLDGTLRELIVYNSDQSDNRTAFEANIGETYNIDLPSGVDTGYDQVDGFVETWYDQSGNGNDAVQQVSGSQPKIVDAGVFLGQVDFLDGVNTFLETNNSDLANLSELSLFGVLEPVTASANEFAISAGSIVNSTGNYGGWALWANGYSDRLDFATQARGSGTNSLAQANITSTSPVVYSATLNGTNGQGAVNGALGTENTSMITPNNTDTTRRKLRLGCQYTFTPASFYRGAIKEVILYNSDQSANRVAIETNINNQYDIY